MTIPRLRALIDWLDAHGIDRIRGCDGDTIELVPADLLAIVPDAAPAPSLLHGIVRYKAVVDGWTITAIDFAPAPEAAKGSSGVALGAVGVREGGS